MKNVVLISLMLISVLLTSIVLTSVANFDKFIEPIELTEEDNSSNPNLLEEEEEHFSTTICMDTFFIKTGELKDLCSAEKIAAVFIEIVAPPPLG